MSKVVLYTNSFPYGNQETFIETEIKYLSSTYKEVIIFPLKVKGTGDRSSELPSNCIVLKPLFPSNLTSYLLKKPIYCLGIFCQLLLKGKIGTGMKEKFFSESVRFILTRSKQFRFLVEEKNNISLNYFYWSFGSIFAIDLIKKSLMNSAIVNRFHGFDLYDERHNQELPYRNEIALHSDLLIFISEQGKEYFLNKYPECRHKSIVSYLGVESDSILSVKSKTCQRYDIEFFSCSSVIKLKRVDRIFKEIDTFSKSSGLQVNWVHIGDGPEMKELDNLIKIKAENLKINLVGRIRNKDIQSIYECSNNKKIFINLSSSEGLPVSIMEACRSNIPIIATDVGGTKEILSSSNVGFLVNENIDSNEVQLAIQRIYENYNSYNSLETWSCKFNADVNYNDLMRKIKCIGIQS